MDQIEFMELIARVADCHFKETAMMLNEKVNRVLDDWLALIGEQRQEPRYFEESDSDLD